MSRKPDSGGRNPRAKHGTRGGKAGQRELASKRPRLPKGLAAEPFVRHIGMETQLPPYPEELEKLQRRIKREVDRYQWYRPRGKRRVKRFRWYYIRLKIRTIGPLYRATPTEESGDTWNDQWVTVASADTIPRLMRNLDHTLSFLEPVTMSRPSIMITWNITFFNPPRT